MFTDQQIFRYCFQGQCRAADPMAVLGQLDRYTGGSAKATSEVARREAETLEERLAAIEARAKLLEAVRLAFDLPSFDVTTGEGTLAADLVAIWNQFCEFIEATRKG